MPGGEHEMEKSVERIIKIIFMPYDEHEMEQIVEMIMKKNIHAL